uniref:Uncharacterized protein n=1 Tax=Kalanchoe fedtschenkoi TaxID=63787 RepID=A0A7N0T6I8_KALFE
MRNPRTPCLLSQSYHKGFMSSFRQLMDNHTGLCIFELQLELIWLGKPPPLPQETMFIVNVSDETNWDVILVALKIGVIMKLTYDNNDNFMVMEKDNVTAKILKFVKDSLMKRRLWILHSVAGGSKRNKQNVQTPRVENLKSSILPTLWQYDVFMAGNVAHSPAHDGSFLLSTPQSALAVGFVQVLLIAWKDEYVIFISPRPTEANSLQNLCTFILMDLMVGQLRDCWLWNTVCSYHLWTFYLMPCVGNCQHCILSLGEHIKEYYQAKDVNFLPFIYKNYTVDGFLIGSTIVRHEVQEAISRIGSIGHCYEWDPWPDLYKPQQTSKKGHAATVYFVGRPWLTGAFASPFFWTEFLANSAKQFFIYNCPSHQVDMIVTDGSRILGLDDFGVQ